MKGFINLTQTNNNKVNNIERLTQEKLDKKPNNINTLIDEETGKISDIYLDKTLIEGLIKEEVQKINAVQIRNKEPNLIITSTIENIQNVATQYIVENYNRQPIQNDGLFITLTDANNDIVKYAYFNNSWVNVGFNDVDLSNYVDLTSNQDVVGNKNFKGNLTKNDIEVATIEDVNELIQSAILDSWEAEY